MINEDLYKQKIADLVEHNSTNIRTIDDLIVTTIPILQLAVEENGFVFLTDFSELYDQERVIKHNFHEYQIRTNLSKASAFFSAYFGLHKITLGDAIKLAFKKYDRLHRPIGYGLNSWILYTSEDSLITYLKTHGKIITEKVLSLNFEENQSTEKV